MFNNNNTIEIKTQYFLFIFFHIFSFIYQTPKKNKNIVNYDNNNDNNYLVLMCL